LYINDDYLKLIKINVLYLSFAYLKIGIGFA